MRREFPGVVRTALALAAVVAVAALAHILVMAGTAVSSGGAAAVGSTTLCHKPGTPAQQTVEVEGTAVPGHLGHGDTVGACAGAPPTTQPTVPPSTAPPITIPSTVPSESTPTPSVPSIPPDGPSPVEIPKTTVEVAGAAGVRTKSSEIRRAFVAGEAVHVAGTAPANCRPVLRVDGMVVSRVAVGPDGSFDVGVATRELAAGRHVAEVVCGAGSAGVLVHKSFWIAAPLTSSDVLSVGMLSMLTLGALGWVGTRTLRDAVAVDSGAEASPEI